MFPPHWIVTPLIVALIALSGCSKAQPSKEAVQQGLMEYLKTKAGLDISVMDVNITALSFRDNEAEASVSFSTKGSKDHASLMKMRYTLQQKDGKWVVTGKAGGSEHGAAGNPAETTPAMPPGHPPTGGKR